MNSEARFYFKCPLRCSIYVDNQYYGKIGPSYGNFVSMLLPLGRHSISLVPDDVSKQSVGLSVLVNENPNKNLFSIPYYHFIKEDANDSELRKLHQKIDKCFSGHELIDIAKQADSEDKNAVAVHALEKCANYKVPISYSMLSSLLAFGPECVRNDRLSDYWHAVDQGMNYETPNDYRPVRIVVFMLERCRVMLDGHRMGVYDEGDKATLFVTEGPHELTIIKDDDDSKRFVIRKNFLLDNRYFFSAAKSTLVNCFKITDRTDSQISIEFNNGGIIKFKILPNNELSVTSYDIAGRYFYFPESLLLDGQQYHVTEFAEYGLSSGSSVYVVLPSTLRHVCTPCLMGLRKMRCLDLGDSLEERFSTLSHHLVELHVGPKIKQIGGFNYLETLVVPEDNPYLCEKDGVVYSKDMRKLIYCTKRQRSVTIPDSVALIFPYAFSNCELLTQVDIPDSVISLGEGSFCSCSSLRNVTLGASLWHVGRNAFLGCGKLTNVNLSSMNKSLNMKDRVIYDKNQTDVLIGNAARRSVVLPQSVKRIHPGAFYGSIATSIQLPAGLLEIGDSAFANTAIFFIDIPESVCKIGYSAFTDCFNLRRVKLSGCINDLPQDYFLFEGCDYLDEVTFDESVKSIDLSILANCPWLETLEIPDNVECVSAPELEFSPEDSDCEYYNINISKLILHSKETQVDLGKYSDRIAIEYHQDK